tara:strand:- start:199 stop:480 length:282 start_codon:yes stop_codon:yes gene_type:complete
VAKSNRATRKELETVIKDMIKELQLLRQMVTAIDNYLGAYVQFKGDAIKFNDYIEKEIEKRQKETNIATKNPIAKDTKSAKKSRYSKVSTPPL